MCYPKSALILEPDRLINISIHSYFCYSYTMLIMTDYLMISQISGRQIYVNFVFLTVCRKLINGYF